jgi:hypothetical protein
MKTEALSEKSMLSSKARMALESMLACRIQAGIEVPSWTQIEVMANTGFQDKRIGLIWLTKYTWQRQR